MVTLPAAEVDGLNAAGLVGVNFAVYEWSPSVVGVMVAVEPTPTEVEPSKNSNVPAVPAGITEAVSVTGAPSTWVLGGVRTKEVVVGRAAGAVMVKAAAAEVDGANATASVGMNFAV